MAISYYKRLYSLDDVDLVVDDLPAVGFDRLNRDELAALNKPFSFEEVEFLIWSMGKYKALGQMVFNWCFISIVGMLWDPRLFVVCWSSLKQVSFRKL